MNRREFQFSEGSSNKFWSIELRDQSFIVHYGKIGTNGQAQEKSFTSAEAAKKEHDKLIAEKTKKGYVEVQVGDASKSRPMPVVKQVEEKGEKKEAAKNEVMSVSIPVQAAVGGIAAAESPKLVSRTVSLTLERRVRLPQSERNRVSWLWQPLERPKQKPFDLEACIRAAKKWHSSYGFLVLYNVTVPENLSKEEAWFWIQVANAAIDPSSAFHYGGHSGKRIKEASQWHNLLSALSKVPLPSKPFTNDAILSMVAETCVDQKWMPLLAPFFDALTLADLLFESMRTWFQKASRQGLSTDHFLLGPSFAKHVLVYEPASVRNELRKRMASRYHSEKQKFSPFAQLALSFMSTVSGGSELEDLLDGPLPTTLEETCLCTEVFLGLRCAEDFVKQQSRFGFSVSPPTGYPNDTSLNDAQLWLAATEWRHLDKIVQAILAGSSKDETTKLARVLALVEAPEAAPAMLEVLMNSKAPAVAAEWFAENPLHTAVGLAPVAMGSGKAAEAARDQLHRLRRSGRQDVLSAALPHLAENEREWLQREIIDHREELLEDLPPEEMPSALTEALAALKPVKAAAWLQSTSLPPIKILGKKLALADVERVLSALKDASFENGVSNSALATLLKQYADAASLDTFAWKLFEQWLAMGAASKDKWALGAIGHIGGDASVLKLTPLVRDWPGESQHQRAVFGLEVLRAVGTDTALMSLNGIAQKLKFQGLKEKAKLMMEGIAQARGFTREQLADRIVPDCGLDEQGGRVFDFGPRQFKFVLGAEMKPLVRDAAGKMKTDLPSPNSSDDKEKAEAAVAAWKLLKKTLKEVLKIQAERLEDAMITGRRWTPEEFHTLLVKHPLMVNLARQLVFGCYDGQGAVQSTFRITEDQSLADSNDDPCDLPGAGSIGVVHPAHLDDAAKSAWGQVLSDYEIIPPFQQLGREICRAESGDLELKEITRFKGPKIPGITVYGILERSHWVKDTPADAGGFMQHSKHFPSANVTAFIQYTGMSMGYYEEPQEIESVYFVPGHVRPEMWGRHDNKLPIKTVDPVVISEVLRLVRAIMAKAE